jgi:TfoX/Sxy family transcriptional regulator of competence genes
MLFMSRNEGFAEYIIEDVLGHIDGISRKALFSGHGVYLDRVIVGIIIDGTFYLKADKEMMLKYKKEGNESFQYEREGKDNKRGKIVEMPYMSVPIETLEDREAIKERVYESFEISNRK